MGSGIGKRRGSAYKASSTPEATPGTPTSGGTRSTPSVVVEEDRVVFLAKVPLFKRLARKQLCLIAAACTPCDFEERAEVITQGDLGHDFFLIQSGEASVHVSSDGAPAKQVASLQAGDYFGEKALLHDVPRTATVIADSRLSTLRLDRDHFHALGLENELTITRRRAIGGGAHTTAKAASAKTPEDREKISEALRRNPHLQLFTTLDDERVQAMIDFCWEESVPAGKAVIVEGDTVADHFYVVKEGSFDVLQVGLSDKLDMHRADPKGVSKPRSAERAAARAKSLRAIGAGGSFGELALLCHAPRSATVQAMIDSTVWVFDRDSFKNILISASACKIKEYIGYVDKVEILQPLWPSERKIIAEALIEVHFPHGDAIMLKGEPGNSLYILIEGEVSVMDGDTEVNRLKSDPSHVTNPVFGERALLNDEPRSATIVAASEIVKTLVLDRTSFNLLLGPLQEIIAHHASASPSDEPVVAKKEEVVAPASDKVIDLKDLARIGLLGCGSFGFVDMYEDKNTGKCYALKAQGKGYLVKIGATHSIVQEKNILKMFDCPFIVRLYETYNTPDFIYFLLELALGGDLHTVYHRKDFWGSEKHARFYVAGVVCAMVHLHAQKVMYRDLKPENIMLTDTGLVKLTDMGLAKVVAGKTYTCCGTPDYFAPEILEGKGYTHAVDWWTVGILTFELMSGYAPFEAGSDAELYRNIRKGIDKVKLPRKWRKVVGDFTKSLLTGNPSLRLPMKVGGTKLLRMHKWYEGFDWQGFANQALPPPYCPEIRGSKDLSNFCVEEDEKPEVVPYIADGSGWDREF